MPFSLDQQPAISSTVQTADQPRRTHHTDFYYPDGNICLIAKDFIFRLYKFLLAQHSVFFRDMFDLSVPSSKEDEYEGVIALQVDDLPEDLTLVFTALWRGPKRTPDLSETCRILRVAIKYVMDDLQEWCTLKLKENLYAILATQAIKPLSAYAEGRIQPTQVIRTARLCNIPEILPLAFYHLATSDEFRPRPAEMFADLSSDDYVRIQAGQFYLARRWQQYLYESRILGIYVTVNKCQNRATHGPCGVGNETTLGYRRRSSVVGAYDPLRYFLDKGPGGVKMDLCSACAEENDQQCLTVARAIFDHLTAAFNLQTASRIMDLKKKKKLIQGPATHTAMSLPAFTFGPTSAAFMAGTGSSHTPNAL